MVTAAMKLKDACSLEGKLCMTNLESILKSRDTTLLTKICMVKVNGFSSSQVGMRVGPQRRLSSKELMLLNFGIGEGS